MSTSCARKLVQIRLIHAYFCLDLTSEDQVTPEEDVYPPHKHGDLKSSKRKKVPEGNNSDVEPSKTKLRSGDVPKSGGQPSSSRVSFTVTIKKYLSLSICQKCIHCGHSHDTIIRSYQS